jgi:hypothetical protein
MFSDNKKNVKSDELVFVKISICKFLEGVFQLFL